MRGRGKVRLGQDSLPNIAISVAETSGNYVRCFTWTLLLALPAVVFLLALQFPDQVVRIFITFIITPDMTLTEVVVVL